MLFAPFEGRVLVASDQAEVIEGIWPKTRTVVVEFPSIDHGKLWYNPPSYKAIIQPRFKAATSTHSDRGREGIRIASLPFLLRRTDTPPRQLRATFGMPLREA